MSYFHFTSNLLRTGGSNNIAKNTVRRWYILVYTLLWVLTRVLSLKSVASLCKQCIEQSKLLINCYSLLHVVALPNSKFTNQQIVHYLNETCSIGSIQEYETFSQPCSGKYFYNQISCILIVYRPNPSIIWQI
jgi:hypothetical protein